MFPGPGVSLLQPVHLWFSFIAMFKSRSKRTVPLLAHILGMTPTRSKENTCTLPKPSWAGECVALIAQAQVTCSSLDLEVKPREL